MNDEDILRQRFGQERPFLVPPGYFDDFAAKLQQQLPDRETQVVSIQHSRWHRLKRYAVAASVAVLIAGAGTILSTMNRQTAEQATASTKMPASNEYSIDQMADYAMIDNQDIYGYLTDNI